MIRPSNFILLLSLFIICLSSCEENLQECYEVVDIRVNSIFSQRITIDSTFTLPDSSQIDSTIISYRDTLLASPKMQTIDEDKQFIFYSAGNTSRFGVPLNPDKESMRYQLQFDSTVAAYDTLTFFYRPVLHFISNACGYTYYYTVDSVLFTTNSLDSVAYEQKSVTNEAAKNNIRFYFFP